MPFEFVCPFCYAKTKVGDEYLGQGGPCVQCGRYVIMPTRNEHGVLISAVQTGVAPRGDRGAFTAKRKAMAIAIGMALGLTSMGVIGGLLWYALPGIRRGISLTAQRRDLDNMRSIVAALNDYCARYGTYPSPSVDDATGKKLYSWRVLILPFLGYEGLYQRFQLDQSWDSPANLALVKEMPGVYGSPNSDFAISNQEASYVLLVGNNTVFPPSGPLARAQITDSPTILLVETRSDGAVWTQPGDIDTSVHGIVIGNKGMKTIGGHHRDHVLVVDSDSKGYRIPVETSQTVLDAMVTPSAGERVDLAGFED